jgi:hypothetical protein
VVVVAAVAEIVDVARVAKLTHVLILVTTILRIMMMLAPAFLFPTLHRFLTMRGVEMTIRQWGVMAAALVEVSIQQGPLLSGLITDMEDTTVVISLRLIHPPLHLRGTKVA